MPVKITRDGGKLPAKTRGEVKPGEVFQVLDKQGRAQRGRYAHLGTNGKKYSVNLGNGNMASTKNAKSRVTIVGKFDYDVKRYPQAQVRNTTRDAVRDNEVFVVGDDPAAMYLHVDRKRDGSWFSVNLVSGDVASTPNGRSNVRVVGTGALNAQVV